ncbi:hypothetical protein BKA24_001152 [Microbacterium marinum]|uniref:GIY-YIG catalytic domain-containing protein n=1 Tax=Microbacterium marinum TaxID=421115 RepID=A0A7W7FIT3_9MICO|nr:hypothetical protein [Microbacterium marinum]MBB4666443.1 hypothetical protein [Microbacterium marinum]
MTHLDDAVAALTGARWSIADAGSHVPDEPGLYAIFGNDGGWGQLGLPHRPDSLLYVGKAEDSLVSRELRGHFTADPTRRAQTGSSTVRRSFAALLHDALGLRGIPRNPANPGHFSNYGLSAEHDSLLTAWMHRYLTLAVWPAHELTVPLRDVESALIRKWVPPLNLAGNPHPAPHLKSARATMANEARTWTR